MTLKNKYKGKIKIPMDKFVPKKIYDLCVKSEKALYDKGYVHSKNHEFIIKDNPGVKGWLYIESNHLMWSRNDMSSYYIIKNENDIECSIKGRTMADIRAERLKLIYGYDDYGYE